MKRFLLSKALLGCMLLAAGTSQAQNMGYFVEPRLSVNAPSAIAGVKDMTYSSDTAGASAGWGRYIDSFWYNQPLVKTTDSLACSPITNGPFNGKWVIIRRGDCEFGAKALAAQQAGAGGVIIANRIANSTLVKMGAGAVGNQVTIPVLFISKEDGDAIYAQLASSTPVFISLSHWGYNLSHDLGLIPSGATLPPYGAIPLNQLQTGSPAAYRWYTGSFVANFGTSTEAAVKLKSTLSFASAVINTDSVTTATFTTLDSIKEMFSPRTFSHNATATGRYDFTQTVTMTAADGSVGDNSETHSMEVTPNVFSKGRYNVATNTPVLRGSTRLASSAAFMWGPLYYVNKGGMNADVVQFAIDDEDTSQHSLAGKASVPVWLFKWVDANADSIMQKGEITAKGLAVRDFTELDSNNRSVTAQFGNVAGVAGEVPLEDNSWYWVGVEVPGATRLGLDNTISYFSTTYAGSNYATSKTWNYWAPLFVGSKNDLSTAGTESDTLLMFPFSNKTGAKNMNLISFSDMKGLTPAVAMWISRNPTTVSTTPAKAEFTLYPNPASSYINVRLEFPAQADKVEFSIADAVGRTIVKETRNNLWKDEVRFSTTGLPSGQYYMVVRANGKSQFSPFTVVGK